MERRGDVHLRHTGGSPWGAVLGSDGAVYVTQGGNVPGSPDQSAVAGIQRVNTDGRWSCSARSRRLRSPAPTTSPSALTAGSGSPTRAPSRTIVRGAGRAAVRARLRRRRRVPDGAAEVYPNGIAFDAQGRLYWTESAAHRVCRLDDGRAIDLLPALRRPRPRRDGVRGRRPGLRMHDDLRRVTVLVRRRRGAGGDLSGRARHQLHLRRPDAVRDRDEGRRDPRRPAHRHVLERRDGRDRAGCRSCPASCSRTNRGAGPHPQRSCVWSTTSPTEPDR